MNSDSPAAVPHGGATNISAVHPDIIQTHIFTRLDGPTIASAACASSHLHAISADEKLWRDICHHTWPSTAEDLVHRLISTFPAAHRSFYYDSFPTLHHRRPNNRRRHRQGPPPTSELISAVDIRYQDRLVISKTHETETVSGWFKCSPFRVDLLDPKETVPSPAKFQGGEDACQSDLEENLTLSWILIDPTRKRAANFSSLRPVSVTRHWLSGDFQVRFATILAGDRRDEFVQCGAVVTCDGKEGGELQVKEVSLLMEDMDGKNLNGKDSLVILQEAMEGGERRKKRGEERERYQDYLKKKRERFEGKVRREKRLDMVCIVSGVTIFLAWTYVFLRGYS
ncbi:unnamed protein product [Camellia sinensis]|uniref:F-box domain-containing protein n=2 Tax=Camellia TaxID=4441 RepID=A0A7J7FSX4_CAMSI|nr:hypothetical protein HYC85_032060 [Camellia sinensis]KAI7984443.1 F-box protein [Camellia lanceoleosa]